MTHFLEVDSLCFNYGYINILRDICFHLDSGELLQIKGENGTGKTTLLEIISGFKEKCSGKIIWNENQTTREFQERFCYLPSESNGLFTDLTAIDNLKFWIKFHKRKLDDDFIEQNLSYWKLRNRILTNNIEIKKFSTGMKRRIALARTFISNSRLLIFDEPTNGLDQNGCFLFINKLKEHIKLGGIAIIVTHDSHLLNKISKKELSLGALYS